MSVDLLSEISIKYVIRGGGMSLLSTFASNLKRYRTERGLSQEEFAGIAGLHRTYISAIEREKRSISLDNIQKIAVALGIDAYLLFVDNDNHPLPQKSPRR